jgi:hypothetical protein
MTRSWWAAIAGIGVAVAVVAAISAPSFRRYMKIEKM